MDKPRKKIAVIDHQIDVYGRSPLVDFLRNECGYDLFFGKSTKEAEIIITSERKFDLLLIKGDITPEINIFKIIKTMRDAGKGMKERRTTPILVLRDRPEEDAKYCPLPLPSSVNIFFCPSPPEVLQKKLANFFK